MYEKAFTDILIHVEFLIPQGYGFKPQQLKGTSNYFYGKYIVTFKQNTILDSILYNIKFPDGSINQYAASTIYQNIYPHIDVDVYSHAILQLIIYYTNGDQ